MSAEILVIGAGVSALAAAHDLDAVTPPLGQGQANELRCWSGRIRVAGRRIDFEAHSAASGPVI